MADEPNYQPTQESLMGTEDQAPMPTGEAPQQVRRAALARQRVVQELTDVAAQGCTLTAEDAEEIRGLLDQVAPKATRRTGAKS